MMPAAMNSFSNPLYTSSSVRGSRPRVTRSILFSEKTMSWRSFSILLVSCLPSDCKSAVTPCGVFPINSSTSFRFSLMVSWSISMISKSPAEHSAFPYLMSENFSSSPKSKKVSGSSEYGATSLYFAISSFTMFTPLFAT